MLKTTNAAESEDYLKYKIKLIEFNKKEKYHNELSFLLKLLNPGKHTTILDFGCGIGTAMKFIIANGCPNTIGYDIINYYGNDDMTIYTNFDDLISKEKTIDRIYFLHSFAHIPSIEVVLKKLHQCLAPTGEVIVITPNLEFDIFFKKLSKKPEFKNDDTVIKHVNQKSLKQIFTDCGFKTKVIGQFGDCPSESSINERAFGIFLKEDNI